MALTFDPRLRPTDDLRGNGPTIYGSYLYPTDLLRADRRDTREAISEPTIAVIRATGRISFSGFVGMQTIAQMQASGTIRFTGSASGAQRLPNVGTVQVRSQVAGVRIWTESL